MLLRVIKKDTHLFVRDSDDRELKLDNDLLLENEIAIQAPACVGDKRIANFDELGEFVSWETTKGQHEPKGNENDEK